LREHDDGGTTTGDRRRGDPARDVTVIGRVGPVGLTLAAVASEVGLVPARWYSGSGPNAAAAGARGLGRQGRRCAARAGAGRARLGPRRAGGADRRADALDGHAGGVRQPTWRSCASIHRSGLPAAALAIHQAQGRAVEALLTEALLAGDLRPGTDVADLGRSVQAIASGAGLVWALERQGSLEQRLRQALDSVLSPDLRPLSGDTFNSDNEEGT